MSGVVADLFLSGLFLLFNVVGLSESTCTSCAAWVTCQAVSGRGASLTPMSPDYEYIAGSMLMYSQFNMTIDGVREPQAVTGPEELASLNSSQLRANRAKSSLQVNLLSGNKCLCSISGSGVLDCSDFALPQPPWPAHTGCQWYLAKGGMLMETNASLANFSCLDSATTSVDMPDFFWPINLWLIFNRSSGDAMFLSEHLLTQQLTNSSWSQQVIDARLKGVWPVRISLLGVEPVNASSGNQTETRIYRKYFGWSRHCLHVCRIAVNQSLVGQETCNDLANPFDYPAMVAQLPNGCVGTFTVTCQPVLVSSTDPALPCQPTPNRLTTTAPGPRTNEIPSTSSQSLIPSHNPVISPAKKNRPFILQAVRSASVTAPTTKLEITALCSLAVVFQLVNFLL